MMGFVHEQVDSGLGYTVDRGVLDLVLALNCIPGIVTSCSCERSAGTLVPWVEFEVTSAAFLVLCKSLCYDGHDDFILRPQITRYPTKVNCSVLVWPTSYSRFVERLRRLRA